VEKEIEGRDDKNKKFVDEIQSAMGNLNSAIQNSEETSGKKKETMIKTIQEKIPRLKTACTTFTDTILNERFLD